ncbi:hypothetical protein E4U26_002246 [Claviceps purpurea]|nr:hypothetical protein E4U26_002246 [Claviceps purpurea]
MHVDGAGGTGKPFLINAISGADSAETELPQSVVVAAPFGVASRDAGNLRQQPSLCVGAKIILTENLWTVKELVNRAIGTVVTSLAWPGWTVFNFASHDASDDRSARGDRDPDYAACKL